VPAELDDGPILTENVDANTKSGKAWPRLLPQKASNWPSSRSRSPTELHKTFKPLFDPSASEEQKQKQQAVLAQPLVCSTSDSESRSSSSAAILGRRRLSVRDDDVGRASCGRHPWIRPTPLTRLQARPSIQAALELEGLNPAHDPHARRLSSRRSWFESSGTRQVSLVIFEHRDAVTGNRGGSCRTGEGAEIGVAPKVTNGCGSRRKASVPIARLIEAELAPRFKSATATVWSGTASHPDLQLVPGEATTFSVRTAHGRIGSDINASLVRRSSR